MAYSEVNDVHAYYGKIHAAEGRFADVVERAKSIVSLIGGNSAGKQRRCAPSAACSNPGQRHAFDGMDVASQPAHNLVSRGVAMVPEGRGVFAKLTVEENLEMKRTTGTTAPASKRRHRPQLHALPTPGRAPRQLASVP
ncbi:MAG: hypothetical protein H6644_13135 [Caldilineaceae bacterium]|nr:hypothetical protein [Caldilineaceae bacterium]